MRQILLLSLVFLSLLVGSNSIKISQTEDMPLIMSIQQSQKVAQDCNMTHFEFQNNVSLGNNDELTKTFIKIGQRIQVLNTVMWKVNETTSYRIYEANPTFKYIDSKQKAEIIGNDSIMIQGGYVQVAIDFKWAKIGANARNGTASVIGNSNQILFAKQIIIEGGFFKYDLLDYRNVTFDSPINLTRITPPQTPSQDQINVMKLVNNILNVTTLKHQLEDEINLSYPFILKMNLHDESMPIDEHFQYKWSSPSRNDFIIKFTRRPILIDIEKDGIHYGYQTKIDGFNGKCGPSTPNMPLSPKIYGGSQQFISYTFYENVIRYGVEQGQMNTQLNKRNWQSRMFQFYAGDLYEIFPKVAERFKANTQVTGECKANASNLRIYKSSLSIDTFNVSILAECQLTVSGNKILDFAVGLQLTVQGKPFFDHVDFVLSSHYQFVTFYQSGDYVMQNELLARQMVSHSISRLYESRLYGSGWPLHPTRDYPHFETEADATFVYDSTHI